MNPSANRIKKGFKKEDSEFILIFFPIVMGYLIGFFLVNHFFPNYVNGLQNLKN